MKKITTILLSSLLSLCALASCNNQEAPFAPKNDLEKVMLKLTNNNFSLDYYCSYLNNGNVEQNQKFYFTDKAYQSDGYLGFGGVAYDNENVFKYTLDNGEVISGQPLINNTSGMRYDNVYGYIQGMQDFDVSKLSYKELGNNKYEYVCGNDYNNDKIFLAVFLRYSILSSVMPEKIIMTVVKDTITFDCVLMSYYLDDGTYVGQNDARATVYNVGTTKLDEINKYLNDGKTSKKPLDNRIIRLINPYMNSNNYTIYLDATGMNQNFKAYEYFTENAYYEEPDYIGANPAIGYIESQGAVHMYTIDEDDKLNIVGTPPADSDGSPYYSLYGGMFQYTFESLYYANFIGYIDEDNPNSYVITDSQFVYTLAYLCYVEINEELYTDRARIEIVDDEKHEFNVYFDLINRATKQDLGTFKASFYDLNNTSIPAVDRYLNIGDNPHTQTKTDLQQVLNKFKEGNYSMDSLTGAGLAKNYFTEDYFFLELYQDKNNNMGFIKLDNNIYRFYIIDGVMSVNKNTSYNNIDLPGVGSAMFSDDDLTYISHFDESICNADNYEVSYSSGMTYWKNTTPGFSQKMYNYVFNSAKGAFPMGSGFTVSNADNGYDTRVTLHSTYVTSDGSFYGCHSFTYYDIGSTSHPIIEAYLASQGE